MRLLIPSSALFLIACAGPAPAADQMPPPETPCSPAIQVDEDMELGDQVDWSCVAYYFVDYSIERPGDAPQCPAGSARIAEFNSMPKYQFWTQTDETVMFAVSELRRKEELSHLGATSRLTVSAQEVNEAMDHAEPLEPGQLDVSVRLVHVEYHQGCLEEPASSSRAD